MRPTAAVITAFFAAAFFSGGGISRGQIPPPPGKRLPPAGIAISAADRAELTARTAELGGEIAALGPKGGGAVSGEEPAPGWADAAIFYKAVDWALRYDEFFDRSQVAFARHLLAEGRARAADLRGGRAPWLHASGLVIRGYVSAIDGSVQPYALVVPPGGAAETGLKTAKGSLGLRRLDVVLSGRNDKRTELAFIAEHEKSAGQIVPEGAILLYPYGRFCNATKFAGESDVFEALDHVRRDGYPVDPNRVVLRGFSMGGASVWHLAAHYPGTWCAASPGAGFAETAIYAKVFAPGKEPRAWWERTLWNWYDATAVAGNLFNCPTIAYSGEIDPQKQSADIMEKAMAGEGLRLERLIGPKTAHKYEPKTKDILAGRLDALAAKGKEEFPREVRLTTYTLRYPEVAWVKVQGMGHHWERADVRARWDGGGSVSAETKNVTALTLALPQLREATIDGQHLLGNELALGGMTLRRDGSQWKVAAPGFPSGRSKRPGLTGPVDDAFMGPILFVRPTGRPLNPRVGAWASAERAHAAKLWRDIFRGEVPVKDDAALTAGDIAEKNLILWGDPSSNRIIGQILGRLPLQWDTHNLVFAGRTVSSEDHAPIVIYPNPLNPNRYVVIDSGIDFRDEAYGTNALQTPKLPDWAIVDLRTPPGPRWPGRIEDAGFFDESWQVNP